MRTFIKTGKIVCWKEGDDWQVGNLLETDAVDDRGNFGITTKNGKLPFGYLIGEDRVLVRHSRTCTETESVVEEFVEWSRLYNYYGDKGYEGIPLHHASETRYSDAELMRMRDAAEEKELLEEAKDEKEWLQQGY